MNKLAANFRVARYMAGQCVGMVKPGTLHLASKEEARTVAQRYVATYSADFRAVEIDPRGYLVWEDSMEQGT